MMPNKQGKKPMHYMAFMKIMDGASKRVSRAISLAGTRQKEVEGGSVLLPDVALYAAGHRKCGQITAR
ncbi:transcriptional antitermination N peptide [Salmonella enterica]|uniref:transcriptional antitermination N peptide n=1 Tax=Salmonella enterica TaxID=28901 RepID=UPI003F92C9F4